MANRLFFRDLLLTAGGTYPAGEQSTLTADYTASSGATLKRLGTNPALPGSMVSHTATSLASASSQSGLYGMFVSNRFGENQDISVQTLTVNIAMQESSPNMNMGAGLTANVYVWRPSTGALVGTICANLALTGAIEPTSGSVRVVQGTSTTTLVSALFADVIICEIWQTHTQSDAVARTGDLFFNGSVVTTINDTLVTDHASFINFSFDNLQIEQGFSNGALDVTLDSLALSANGTVTDPLPSSASNPGGGGGHGRIPDKSSNRKFKKLLEDEFKAKPKTSPVIQKVEVKVKEKAPSIESAPAIPEILLAPPQDDNEEEFILFVLSNL